MTLRAIHTVAENAPGEPEWMAPVVLTRNIACNTLPCAFTRMGLLPQYADTKPRRMPIWFALAEDRPLFAFAGLWTPWRGVRGPKSAPVEGEHELFGFLTTEPNAIVAPIHPKAMPVILTTPAEVDRWLGAETPDALELQRPLPDEGLRIVASGERSDSYDIIDTL